MNDEDMKRLAGIGKEQLDENDKVFDKIKLIKEIYGKFTKDSKSKRGDEYSVFLTGNSASEMGESDYTTVKLNTKDEAWLKKLATVMKVEGY